MSNVYNSIINDLLRFREVLTYYRDNVDLPKSVIARFALIVALIDQCIDHIYD